LTVGTILLLLVVLGPAAGENPEAGVLDGPCLAEGDAEFAGLHEWHGLVSRHAEAARRGERESAIELAKRIVRSRCSNEHWWLKLAESLVEADRLEESVAALQALYDRKSHAVDRRLLAPDSPLGRLLESDFYQRSALAAALAGDRRALEKRRSEARARAAALPRPPAHYVAKPACPFECCGFGRWRVREDTTLYDRPGGTQAAGRIFKGEEVEAVTGEVHLRPLAVAVRFASPNGLTVEEGAIVFLLDYLGEGHGRIWFDGRIVESEILSVHEHCAFPGPDCWGEFINPEDAGRQRSGVWWVQVKTRAGTVGWTREAGHFSGMDGCS